MDAGRLVIGYLLLCAFAILAGLAGWLVARFGGYDSLGPVFGRVTQAGMIGFAAALAVGLCIGARHTWNWTSRTVGGLVARLRG